MILTGLGEILVAFPVGPPHEICRQIALVAVIIGRLVDFMLALFARIAHLPDFSGQPTPCLEGSYPTRRNFREGRMVPQLHGFQGRDVKGHTGGSYC